MYWKKKPWNRDYDEYFYESMDGLPEELTGNDLKLYIMFR